MRLLTPRGFGGQAKLKVQSQKKGIHKGCGSQEALVKHIW